MPECLTEESDESSRREFLKEAVAVTALAATTGASAAESPSSRAATSPTTQAISSQAATDITVADIAAADRIAGRDYFSDGERNLMREGLVAKREVLRSLHSRHISEIEPCVHFAALSPTELPSGPSLFKLSEAPVPEFAGRIETLAFASAADLSRLIHAKKVSSLELTKMYLDRLRTIGSRLNCVITLTDELALQQARRADDELAQGRSRGPLHGIPYGIKDLVATGRYPTTWGVELFKDRILGYDASVVKKLGEAGAVVCAKLSLGELCMGDVWYNGLTRCPWNLKEGSSGSSAGPCAATAAGLVGFAIGSETLGSIISPCMTNGTTGLRPTYGRVSRHGAMSLSFTMDKLGTITRTIEDAAMVFAAIHGPDANDPTSAELPFVWNPSIEMKKLRVGYDPAAFAWGNAFYRKNPELQNLYQAAFESIKSLSLVGDLVPIHLPSADEYKGLASFTISCEAACNFTELMVNGDVRRLRQQDEGSWPHAFRVGSTIPASDYLRAMKVRTSLQRAMAETMKGFDLYLTLPYVGPTVSFTNLTGHPSLVTRVGMQKGRPKLIEFIGQPFREDLILRLAFEYERRHEWTKHWPDTSKIEKTSTAS